jgi:hypothetical protein
MTVQASAAAGTISGLYRPAGTVCPEKTISRSKLIFGTVPLGQRLRVELGTAV